MLSLQIKELKRQASAAENTMDWKPGDKESRARPAVWPGHITGLSGPQTSQIYQELGRTTGKDLSEVPEAHLSAALGSPSPAV